MPFPTLDPDMVDANTNATRGELLLEQAASASTELLFTGAMSSTYSQFLIVVDELVMSTVGTALRVQLSKDDGATYISAAASYGYGIHFTSTSGQHGVTSSNSATFVNLASNFGIETEDHINGYCRLYGANEAGKTTDYEGVIMHGTNGSPTIMRSATGGGLYGDTSVINAFRIYPSAGTFTSGTVKLYGIK